MALPISAAKTSAFYRSLVEQVPIIVLTIDRAGRITFINHPPPPAKPADVLGHSIYDYIAKEDAAIVRAAIDRVISTGQKTSYELYSTGDFGAKTYYCTQIAPIAPGNTDELILATIDITEHTRNEAVMRERNEQLSLFLDHFPALAWIKDAQMRYVYVNRAYEESLNLKPGECIGKSTTELWPADVAGRFDEKNKQVLDDVTAARLIETTRVGDVVRHWLVTKFPILPQSTGAKFIGGVALDITETKRAEKERQELDHKLFEMQKFESLGVLAGGVAHDFNNLLAIILGNINIARWNAERGMPLEPQLETIESIALQAASICRQMLAYAGKKSVEIAPVDVPRAIADVKDLVKSIAHPSVTLDEEFQAGLPTVPGDAVQLRQVFLNLLMNALEAIGNKHGAVRIKAGTTLLSSYEQRPMELHPAAPQGQFIYVSVEDDGCGMTQQVKSRIFDPFFSTKFTGRGLGLAAVIGIVRNHRGGIRVQTEAGKGTTFTVYLPQEPAVS